MYLFRALNEFDIASNPKKNGLASKQMLFDITKAHYEKIEEYKKLLLNLKTFVNLINDSQMMYVFNELYLDNNNIKKIEDKLEPEKIEYQKKKILGLAKELNNAQIKH